MNKYIFYTGEGHTASPTGENVENLQILGFGEENTANEAFKNIMDSNPWILKTGFNENEIHNKQVYN